MVVIICQINIFKVDDLMMIDDEFLIINFKIMIEYSSSHFPTTSYEIIRTKLKDFMMKKLQ